MLFNTDTHTHFIFFPGIHHFYLSYSHFHLSLGALRFMSGVRRDWSKCYRVTCEWVLCLQVS